MRSKVKVDKQKLIDAIKARKAEAKAQFEASKEKSKAEDATYEMRVVDALESALVAAHKGRPIYTESWSARNVKGSHFLNLPGKPDKITGNFDSGRYDRDIAILEMSPEETISISTEDFERYVR